MNLIHSTNGERAISILKSGLYPSKFGYAEKTSYDSNPEFIYFKFLDTFSPVRLTGWMADGFYHFLLNLDWLRENGEQFEERADPQSPEFKNFLLEFGIEDGAYHWGVGDIISDQVISLKPVPLISLDSLIIGAPFNEPPDMIIDPQSNQEILLRDILPKHMKLFYRKSRDEYEQIAGR